MPELPEVETIRRDLAAKIVGRKITSVNILSPKTASHSAAFFVKALVGRHITKVERRGKLLILALSASRLEYSHLLIHLKMTGQLIYQDKTTAIAGGHSLSRALDDSLAASVGGKLPNKHTRAIFSLAAGGRLFFNDLRKFGYLKLTTEAELARILKNNYGPEPLSSDFSLPFLTTRLQGKTTKIKAFLLDQKMIAGLGNIYVDESLWAARVRPNRAAGSLKSAEVKKLRQEINRIIKLAIKQRGTTFSNYVDSRGRRGNFSRFLKVYGRGGEKCSNCGRPVAKIKIAGRGTHYCPSCQK